jgi:hypothetical protein
MKPGSVEFVRQTQDAHQLLDAFVGHWDVKGTVIRHGHDDPLPLTGLNEVQWEAERSFLSARGVTRLGDGVETHGLGAWTYDYELAAFRTVAVSSSGAVAVGTAGLDPEDQTWHARMTSAGPGGRMVWTGSIRFLDPDTKEEHWTARKYASLICDLSIIKTEHRRREPRGL